MMIPTKRVIVVMDLEKEVKEAEEHLLILKRRLKIAEEDHDLFLRKLAEVEK